MARYGTILLILITALCSLAAAQEPQRVDLSTPQGAVKAYFAAIKAGDANAAKAASLGNEGEQALVEAAAAESRAKAQLIASATKRWGETETSSRIGWAEDMLLHLADKSSVTVDADRAVIGKRGDFVCRRIDNQWRFDLSAQTRDEPISASITRCRKAQAVYQRLAREIDAGQWQTLDAVLKERDAQIPPPPPPPLPPGFPAAQGISPSAPLSPHYATPADVVAAAMRARTAKDWSTWVDCMTPEAQDMGVQFVIGFEFLLPDATTQESPNSTSAPSATEKAAHAQFEALLAKHGLKDRTRVPKEEDKAYLARLAGQIRDKRSFLIEQMTMADKADPADIPKPHLVNLKIEGDSAKGELATKEEDGSTTSVPIEFKKINNSWLIASPPWNL